MKSMKIKLKRVYEKPAADDGFRILVDRLWPRGIAKDAARIDLWLKDVAPSTELRKWFDHDPKKWRTFRSRYFRELAACPEAVAQLTQQARRGAVTLLYGAKDEKFNQAVALKEFLAARRSS